MSAEVWHEAAEPLRIAQNAIEPRVNGLLANHSLKSDAKEWVLITILAPNDLPDYPEVHRYDGRRKTFDFRLRIPYREFLKADQEGQKGLILESLLRSVTLMMELGLYHSDAGDVQDVLLKLRRTMFLN